MAKILIKKRVELGFLGEEHQKDYLVFRAVSLREYDGLVKKINEMKNEEAEKQSTEFIVTLLKEHFLEGKFATEDVGAEDLADFDLETILNTFNLLVGRTLDPKLQKP